jgi:hypothetical protein
MTHPRRLEVPTPASPLLLTALVLQFLFPTTVLAQETDTTPPQLVDFSFSPTSIDLSAGLQDVTATFQVTDDLSGAEFPQVNFSSPPAQQFQSIAGQLVAGDPLDGTFVGTVSFPQLSENGTWTVAGVSFHDLVGNFTTLDPAALQARGFPTELTVSSDLADVTGPMVTGIDISPPVVDVSDGPQDITVTLEVTDDLSGATFTPSGVFFFFPLEFLSPSGAQRRFIYSFHFTQVSGGTLNGAWEGTFTMPEFSEPGAGK